MAQRDDKGRFTGGNRAAMRHGCRAALPLGKFPAGASYLARLAKERQAALLGLIGEKGRDPTPQEAALVQTIVALESMIGRAQRWLAQHESGPPSEKADLARMIAHFHERRDAKLSRLLAGNASQPEAPNPLQALLAGLGGPIVTAPGDRPSGDDLDAGSGGIPS